jgi:hypothetical protein
MQELKAGTTITIWNKCGLSDWLLETLTKLRKHLLAMSVCLSVRMEQLGSHWRIFIKFGFWVFFENLPRKLSLIKIEQE